MTTTPTGSTPTPQASSRTGSAAADCPDMTKHLPTILVGLRWLYDTEQPATAIHHQHGAQLASVDDRIVGFCPSGWNGHVVISLTATAPGRRAQRRRWLSLRYPNAMRPPHVLAPGELEAFAALLSDLGEEVVSTWSGYPGRTGSVALARPAHASLRAAVARDRAGCPEHGHADLCDCDWSRAGRRDVVTVREVLEQAHARAAAFPVLSAWLDPHGQLSELARRGLTESGAVGAGSTETAGRQ